ncbi:MAG: four helix bundle protein [Bacteroidetes bacterium]|nr:four helix bundle protein [Bacteroidota bacterium]
MIYEKDIKDWTKKFAIKIVKFTIDLKKDGVEYALRDQLLRSGTSVGANVKEAKASSSRRELIRYYEIALRSGDESEYWLDVIKEGYELQTEKFEIMNSELKQIMNVIARIIINLKK